MARILIGRVINVSADKTIVVRVQTRRTHPLYQKQYSVTTKFLAHDADSKAQRGDWVAIVETRPMSARKHFKLDKIIEQAGVQFEDSDATADLPPEPVPEPVDLPTATPKKAAKRPLAKPATKAESKEPKS